MQHHRLSDGVTFCEIADQIVFLDLRRDRYFRLGPAAERAFRRLQAGAPESDAEGLDRLLATNLVIATDEPCPIRAVAAATPLHSLVELQGSQSRSRSSMLPEILLRLILIRLQLRRGRLSTVLAKLSMRNWVDDEDRARSDALIATYLATRRMLPMAPNCLRDSVALGRFLARRGLPFKLVFGVKVSPFAAHCWLQSGMIVLNDSLDSVADFRPILVI